MADPPDLSPREARDRWLDKLAVEVRESSLSSYFYRLKLFVEWCDDEGIESIGDLSGWDLESYEAHRRSQGIAPVTLSGEMSTLNNFLEYCARIGVVDADLPEKVSVPRVSREDETSETRLTADTATALLEYYRDSAVAGTRGHTLLELAWVTGARVGGLRALDLRDYDPDAEYVVFKHRPETGTPLKNGLDGERPVALPSAVCGVVDRYIRDRRPDVHDDEGRQPLIASKRGRPTPGSLRDWTYQATVPCHYRSCPHEKDPETCQWRSYSHASKCPSSRSPHQVRTGAISWMLDQGLPVEVVCERVNATPRVIAQHYDKTEPIEEMERRRRPFVDRLTLDSETNSS